MAMNPCMIDLTGSCSSVHIIFTSNTVQHAIAIIGAATLILRAKPMCNSESNAKMHIISVQLSLQGIS